MATKTIQTRVSDLSGQEGAQAVSFAFNGVSYAVDLTEEEFQGLHEVLARYIGVATKVPGSRGRAGGSPGRSGTAKRGDLDAVRAWARENGHEVSDRGRVPGAVLAAYDAAH